MDSKEGKPTLKTLSSASVHSGFSWSRMKTKSVYHSNEMKLVVQYGYDVSQ